MLFDGGGLGAKLLSETLFNPANCFGSCLAQADIETVLKFKSC